MNRKGNALLIAGCGFADLALLIAVLLLLGLNADHWYALQMRYSSSETIGLSEEALMQADRELAGFLRGSEEALLAAGRFHPWEVAHLRDVAQLFRLARYYLAGLGALAAVGIIVALRRIPKDCRGSALIRAFAWAFGGLLAMGAVCGIWIARDFTAAFFAFHELAFQNDLWLLNPETDLLIRMCPEALFSNLALQIGGVWLGTAGLLPGILWAAGRVRKSLAICRHRP